MFQDKNSTEDENPAADPDANDNEELNVDDFFEDLLWLWEKSGKFSHAVEKKCYPKSAQIQNLYIDYIWNL